MPENWQTMFNPFPVSFAAEPKQVCSPSNAQKFRFVKEQGCLFTFSGIQQDIATRLK